MPEKKYQQQVDGCVNGVRKKKLIISEWWEKMGEKKECDEKRQRRSTQLNIKNYTRIVDWNKWSFGICIKKNVFCINVSIWHSENKWTSKRKKKSRLFFVFSSSFFLVFKFFCNHKFTFVNKTQVICILFSFSLFIPTLETFVFRFSFLRLAFFLFVFIFHTNSCWPLNMTAYISLLATCTDTNKLLTELSFDGISFCASN